MKSFILTNKAALGIADGVLFTEPMHPSVCLEYPDATID